jgi:hypothetical protein
VTYVNSSGGIDLPSTKVNFIATGTVSGCSVSSIATPSVGVRRVHITGCGGNGTVSISIAEGTSTSATGVTAPAATAVSAVSVDNTAPTVTIGSPTKSDANASVSFAFGISYSEVVTANLTIDKVELFGSATAGCTVSVTNGTSASPTVQVGGCSGNGNVRIRIASGVASDVVGNASGFSADSNTVNIDNTAPTVAISAPNQSHGNSSSTFSFPIVYSGTATYALTSAKISLSGTGTAGCVVGVNQGATANPTVTITGCTGNGDLKFYISSGAAFDAATNATTGSAASADVFVDNSAPTIALGAPSTTNANSSTAIVYQVSYSGAATHSLVNTNVQFSGSASAGCSASVNNGTTSAPTITVTGCSGNGIMQFSVQSGTASDLAGNLALASSLSVIVNIDNSSPSLAIAAPSKTVGNNLTAINFPITYSGATSVNLTQSKVILNGAAAGCSIAVNNGTSTTPTVSLTGCTGNGNLNFTIDGGTALDDAGNSAPASAASTSVVIDNTLPTITGLVSDNNPVTSVSWSWGCSDVSSPCLYRYRVSTVGLSTPFLAGDAYGANTATSQNGGSGTYYLYVQAKDSAGNVSLVREVTANLNSNKPSVIISAPSLGLAKSSSVISFDVNYSNVGSITLNAGDVSISQDGTVSSCSVQSITDLGGNDRRINVSGCTGDGTMSISLAAGTATSPASLQADAQGPSAQVTIDNTKPTLALNTPNTTLIRNGQTVSFVVSYGADSIVQLTNGLIQLSGTGSTGCTANVVNGTSLSPTVQISGCTGNGNLQFSINAGSSSDAAGNLSVASSNSAIVTVDNAAPTLAIGAPSISNATSGSTINIGVTYSGADSVNLTTAQVNLSYSGNVSCLKSVSGGTTSAATVTLSNCTGDGSVQMSIASGTASDIVGNSSAGQGPSSSINVDNTAPTIAISAPNFEVANSSRTVSYTVSLNGGTVYTLTPAKISLGGTATAGCSVGVANGSTSSVTVNISGCTGNGSLEFNIAAGAVTDAAGNSSGAYGPSPSVTIDNQAPTVVLGEPSVALAKASTTIDIPVNYAGESSITLTSTDVQLVGASTGCTKSILGTSGSTRTIRLNGCSGDGSLQVRVAAGSAQDSASNSAAQSGLSTAVTMDNSGPTISIASPSPSSGASSASFVFSFTYTGADSVALTEGHLSVSPTGTVTCSTPVLSGGTTSSPQVTVSNCSGEGTIVLNVGAGSATDTIGNTAGSKTSAAATVDNTPPTLSIGAGAPSNGRSATNFVYTVTYTGASSISLNSGMIQFSGAGATGCSAGVTGSGAADRTVTVSGCTGTGEMSFSINSDSAVDAAGNFAMASSTSAAVTIDNTGPTLSWGTVTPAVGTSATTFSFNLSYEDYTSVNLISTGVTVSTTGTVKSCSVPSISNGGTGSPLITITGCQGEGTLKIKINGNTAYDAAGNGANGSAWSTTVTIDNTLPTVAIGTPSPSLGNVSTNFSYILTFTDAAGVNFDATKVTLSGEGMVGCSAEVSGVTLAGATVTVSGCSGNGAMHISINSGAITDSSGLVNLATGISSQAVIDNAGPSVAVGAGAPALGNATTHFLFKVSYTSAVSASLSAAQVALVGSTTNCAIAVTNGTTLAPTIDVSGCTDDGSLQVRVNAGVALDALNNPSGDSDLSAAVTLQNSGITIGYDSGYTKLDYKNGSDTSYLDAGLGVFGADISSTVNVHGYKATGVLSRYEMAVGNVAGSDNVSAWTSVGTSLSAPLNTTGLLAGHQYFAAIRAVNASETVSGVLSDSSLFMKYAADGAVTEANTSEYGASVAVSSDGLRMIVGDPAENKVFIYKRNSGSRQPWTLLANFSSILESDNIVPFNGARYGASVAILKIGIGKYLYVIGAPDALTSGTTIYGGRVVSHFESEGTVGPKLQVLRGKDLNNANVNGAHGDLFGESLSFWNNGSIQYLLVGAPGQNCPGTSINSCGTSLSNAGALFAYTVTCASEVCDSTSFVVAGKYGESPAVASAAFGTSIKSTGSGYFTATTSKIYRNTAVGHSSTTVATGLSLSTSSQIAVCETDTALGKPLVAYLDATGTAHLGKFDGSNFVWKTGTESGWTSIALFSDTTAGGTGDQQGVSMVLGNASASPRAAMGLLDWSLESGYQIKQELAPLATGLGTSEQFGKSVVIHDNYITVTAPGANKIYNFN